MRRWFMSLMAAALVFAFAPAAVAQTSGGQVFVVHGIPGLTVDVFVNGDAALEGFAPGDVAGPLELPAGDYDLAIAPEGAGIDAAVLTGSATVTDGANVSIVAHLTEGGDPTITIFGNDLSEIEAGNGRLIVRHTAAAPTVDILLADGTELFTGVSNPQEGKADVPAGSYDVEIAPAGAGVEGSVFSAPGVALNEGTALIVYATGSLADGTFGLVTQSFDGLTAPAPSGEGQVSVVHGIPGLTVDVFVNGDATLEGFAPGEVAGPLTLPEGDYELAIAPEGAGIDAAVLTGSATVTDGLNASIVAHLTEAGDPTITIFANDLSTIAGGEARLIVRHTAAAPTVDILLADGTELFTGVSNPQEGKADVPAGSYDVEIAPAGAGVEGSVFSVPGVELAEGSALIVYATGSLADGTFGLVTQAFSGLGEAPGEVPTGGTPAGFPVALVVALMAIVLVAGAATPLVARRGR